jgi:hypothetical protein
LDANRRPFERAIQNALAFAPPHPTGSRPGRWLFSLFLAERNRIEPAPARRFQTVVAQPWRLNPVLISFALPRKAFALRNLQEPRDDISLPPCFGTAWAERAQQLSHAPGALPSPKAVNSSPVISRRYPFTSAELTAGPAMLGRFAAALATRMLEVNQQLISPLFETISG